MSNAQQPPLLPPPRGAGCRALAELPGPGEGCLPVQSPRLRPWGAGGRAGRAALEKSNLAPQDCWSSAPKPWSPLSCMAGTPSLPGAERGAGEDTGRRTRRAEITLQLRDLTQVFGLRRRTRVFHCGARRTLEAILSGSGGPGDPRRAPPAPLPGPRALAGPARASSPSRAHLKPPGDGGGQAWARQALGPRAAAGPPGVSKSPACKPRCGPRPHTRPPAAGPPHSPPSHPAPPHLLPLTPVPHTLPSSAPCNRAPTLAPFTPRASHPPLLGPPQPRPRTPPTRALAPRPAHPHPRTRALPRPRIRPPCPPAPAPPYVVVSQASRIRRRQRARCASDSFLLARAALR